MNATEYRQSLDALPFGKRLPGAVYVIDPGDDPRISSLLRITVMELRKRLGIGVEFNLLKFGCGKIAGGNRTIGSWKSTEARGDWRDL